jgi:hypothetical protein
MRLIERGTLPAQQRPGAHALAQNADTRKAGEKAVEAMPAMIYQAAEAGMKAPDIARLLDLTPSWVYRVIRERPAEQADIQ